MRWNHKHTNANTQIQRYTNTQIKSVSVPHVLNLSSQLQFAKLHSNRMFTSASYYEKQCLYLRIIISHCICIYIYCNAQWAQLPVCVSCGGRRRHIWRSCEAPQACTLQPAVFLFFVFCICLLVFFVLCIHLTCSVY